MPDPRAYVCTKRGCGKKGERRVLLAELDTVAEVVPVRCQSVCDGPVVGLVVAGRLQWFERVRKRKARAGAVAVLGGRATLPGALAKRRVPKRAGKLRA